MTNILDFGASAVKSLAWPAVVVTAMAMFRIPLTTLLGRVRRVAVSEGTAVIDFRAALANVEARLQPGGTTAPVPHARVAALLQSSQPPEAIIDAAWIRLQDILWRGHAPVPAATGEVVATLQALRNQVVAGTPGGLTTADALRFEDATAAVIAKMESG